MKWIRERDALIAQTLAFVQSVTGRKEDVQGNGGVAAPPAPVMDATAVEPAEPAPESLEPPPAPAEPPAGASQLSPPRTSGDFRAEVLARVASFRKHQERFEREREAYYAATLAKARAALPGASSAPPPRT